MLPIIAVTDLTTAEWLLNAAHKAYAEDMRNDTVSVTGAAALVALDSEVRKLRAALASTQVESATRHLADN